jgi:uncharacterized protein involved in outer membrane biogenesis
MARKRRWFSRLLLFSTALGAAGFLLAPFLPLDSLKPQVESRLSATLGRKVAIGSMRLTMWGGPYLTINGMTAKEDPAYGDGDFLKADQVRANFSLVDYALRRQVVIDGITIRSPEFAFIKNGDGAWSWTTLGASANPQTAAASFSPARILSHMISTLIGDIGNAKFNSIHIEDASVRIIDKTGAQIPESLYKNIALDASLSDSKDAASARRATGQLRAESEEGNGAERLKAAMPFDVVINRGAGAGFSIKGNCGPGPLETKNLTAQSFKLDGEFNSERASSMNGGGHMSASEIFIPSLNVSQQVAQAARVAQIGDMADGTKIGGLETDFNFDRDAVRTNNLRVEQLDGLGDATADPGWFKVEAALMLNYAARVELSSDATAQLKTSANPLIGAAVAVLQTNNRIAVPLNITGDVRNPNIQVDVLRAITQ